MKTLQEITTEVTGKYLEQMKLEEAQGKWISSQVEAFTLLSKHSREISMTFARQALQELKKDCWVMAKESHLSDDPLINFGYQGILDIDIEKYLK